MSPATHAPIGRPHPRMLTRANTDGEDTIFHQTVARKRKHPHVMAKVESKPRSDLPARRALSSQSVRPSVVYIASMAEVPISWICGISFDLPTGQEEEGQSQSCDGCIGCRESVWETSGGGAI